MERSRGDTLPNGRWGGGSRSVSSLITIHQSLREYMASPKHSAFPDSLSAEYILETESHREQSERQLDSSQGQALPD